MEPDRTNYTCIGIGTFSPQSTLALESEHFPLNQPLELFWVPLSKWVVLGSAFDVLNFAFAVGYKKKGDAAKRKPASPKWGAGGRGRKPLR